MTSNSIGPELYKAIGVSYKNSNGGGGGGGGGWWWGGGDTLFTLSAFKRNTGIVASISAHASFV